MSEIEKKEEKHPYKLDSKVTEPLLTAIRLGMFIEHACAYAGINSSTFRRWRQDALDGIEPFKSFWPEVTKAEADSIIRRMSRIEQAAIEGNWTADAWVLERKYPDKFGKRDRLEISAENNQPKEVNLTWAEGGLINRDEIIIDKKDEEE
jgi:hypothetical protein